MRLLCGIDVGQMTSAVPAAQRGWIPGKADVHGVQVCEGYVGFYYLAYFIAITHFSIYIRIVDNRLYRIEAVKEFVLGSREALC